MHAVLPDHHHGLGLWPDALQHPLAHPGTAHAGEPRDLAEDHLNLLLLGGGVLDGGLGQRTVEAHTPVIDALVDVVVEQLIIRQTAHGLGEGPHGPHVLFAVFNHLLHQRGVLAERAVALRDRQRPHQRSAPVVLHHAGPGEATDVLQAARRAVGAGLGRRAVEPLQRGLRYAKVGTDDVPEDQPLKGGVVRADLAVVDGDARRERMVRRPRLHVLVIEGVGHAEHLCGWVLGVVVHAPARQVAARAGFKVDPEHDVNAAGCRVGSAARRSPLDRATATCRRGFGGLSDLSRRGLVLLAVKAHPVHDVEHGREDAPV